MTINKWSADCVQVCEEQKLCGRNETSEQTKMKKEKKNRFVEADEASCGNFKNFRF